MEYNAGPVSPPASQSIIFRNESQYFNSWASWGFTHVRFFTETAVKYAQDPRTHRIAWSASEFKPNAAWLFENSLTSPFSH